MFNGITHVIRNPAGTFSLVGAVPRALCDEREPTRSDILGGRVDMQTRMVYRPRVYQTAREAFTAVDAVGTGCTLPTCACATLRGAA
jgi:hypothetical protein